MEFGFIMLALFVGFLVHRAIYRPDAPLIEAKKSLREGKSIHAENIVLRAHRKVAAKHGEDSLEAAYTGNDLALVVLLAGEPRRAEETLEPVLKILREKGTPEAFAQAVCTRAMIFTATDSDTPAFIDLDDLTDTQLEAISAEIARSAPELPPVLAAPLLTDGVAFLDSRANETLVQPLRDVATELARKAKMAAALQLQASAEAEACGDGGCGDGGGGGGGCCGGPAGEVDSEFSQQFATLLFTKLPEGMVRGVEMRREGDALTPRVQVARQLSPEEERQLKNAIGETMAELQSGMKLLEAPEGAEVQPSQHG